MIDLTPSPFPAREGGPGFAWTVRRAAFGGTMNVKRSLSRRSLGGGVVRTARFWAIEVR
jgi:hypothetical protein